ncbi:MAG TPA: glycoside hydrolase family 99-like domain-containing protein [Terriglobia bacterium]|nr:glycoside hydrolase family 99-like domain-containing protein [Terriglobia bacterium]
MQELGSVQSSSSEIDRKLQDWIELMRSPTFFSVQEGGSKRPLLFLFYRPEEMTKYFKTLDSLRSCLERFRKLAVRAGVGKPYIVLFNPAVDMTLFRDSGADAISNYISQLEPRKAASYIDLDRQVQRYWKRMAASGAPMIPIAQVGWDTRPRKDNPVPWEKKTGDKENYYKIATPEEFYNHIRAARQFVENNSDKCVSRVVLIYSWDECDEGGCIMPTIGDPTGKYLAALKRAMD